MKVLLIAILLSFYSFISPAQQQYDICVYGETVAGISSAIQAARMGKKVVLISQTKHIGGTTTSGLTATDMNRNTMVGGIAREFYQNIYTYYKNPQVWRNQNRDDFFVLARKRTYSGKNDSSQIQWVYESHVAENLLKDMLKEAGVEVVYSQRLNLKKKVKKENNAIRSIEMEDGSVFSARIFIDASYEGDLMAKAGVKYTVGREANSQYNETLNGIRVEDIDPSKNETVDPYIIEGDKKSGVLPFVDKRVWGKNGEKDKRVQAFCYRVTLTNDPDNRVAIQKPANYNALWYEILIRRMRLNPSLTLQKIITLTPMPNRKTDTNHLDFFGASFDYPEADYEKRAMIAADHKSYAIGMLWTLANDARVPEHIRQEMNDWGFPKDEFQDTEHFPNQLYVREARRMIGEFVMTERNVAKTQRDSATNSIGLGTYALDCHYVSRVIGENGKVVDEGTIFVPTTPYAISYQSIVPKEKECANLLVPVCLSASHVAISSIRMEPVYMILGQSAGAAAALALDNQVSVQKVPYVKLKEVLLRGNQIITVINKK